MRKIFRFTVSKSPIRIVVLAALAISLSSAGHAATLTLSDVSSDATPAASLSGTITLAVLGGNVLSLTLENQTSAPNEFNINGVWCNADGGVTSLALSSATHSSNGDVLAAWTPVEAGTSANGFGSFDFALTDGVGAGNPNIIDPGESIVFLMGITGSCTSTACTGLSGGGEIRKRTGRSREPGQRGQRIRRHRPRTEYGASSGQRTSRDGLTPNWSKNQASLVRALSPHCGE